MREILQTVYHKNKAVGTFFCSHGLFYQVMRLKMRGLVVMLSGIFSSFLLSLFLCKVFLNFSRISDCVYSIEFQFVLFAALCILINPVCGLEIDVSPAAV